MFSYRSESSQKTKSKEPVYPISGNDFGVSGCSGIKAGIFSEKTGKLVNLKQIKADQDVILISDSGTIIRLEGEQISKIGRNTQGVKIMRLKDKNYRVVCASVTEHEEQEEEIEDLDNAEQE